MPQILRWVVLALTALFALTLAAVTGFGGAAVLLPVLVAIFGIREAIPVLTVAQLVGNGSNAFSISVAHLKKERIPPSLVLHACAPEHDWFANGATGFTW